MPPWCVRNTQIVATNFHQLFLRRKCGDRQAGKAACSEAFSFSRFPLARDNPSCNLILYEEKKPFSQPQHYKRSIVVTSIPSLSIVLFYYRRGHARQEEYEGLFSQCTASGIPGSHQKKICLGKQTRRTVRVENIDNGTRRFEREPRCAVLRWSSNGGMVGNMMQRMFLTQVNGLRRFRMKAECRPYACGQAHKQHPPNARQWLSATIPSKCLHPISCPLVSPCCDQMELIANTSLTGVIT